MFLTKMNFLKSCNTNDRKEDKLHNEYYIAKRIYLHELSMYIPVLKWKTRLVRGKACTLIYLQTICKSVMKCYLSEDQRLPEYVQK